MASVGWTGLGQAGLDWAMSETAASIAFAVELLSDLGLVRGRRMFGGAGLYAGEVMFGLIDDEVIYLKADAALKADLAAAGSHAWIYSRRPDPDTARPQESGYWSLPDTALDDPDEACAWARRALAVAEALKAAKPVRKKVSEPTGPRRRPSPRR